MSQTFTKAMAAFAANRKNQRATSMIDRKAIAAAFRAAKKLLWNGRGPYPRFGKCRFICHALIGCDAPEWETARQIIRDRIGRPQITTFDEWLIYQGIPSNQITDKRLQDHRLAWLDMLIVEFEGEET